MVLQIIRAVYFWNSLGIASAIFSVWQVGAEEGSFIWRGVRRGAASYGGVACVAAPWLHLWSVGCAPPAILQRA